MKQSKSPKESFGTLPDSPEGAESAPDGVSDGVPHGVHDKVLVPHSDSDSADLERVRDLLFGQASRAHASRLKALEASIAERLSALEEDYDERLKKMESQLRAELQSEVAAVTARLDEHGSRKVERADLRSVLADLAERIGD